MNRFKACPFCDEKKEIDALYYRAPSPYHYLGPLLEYDGYHCIECLNCHAQGPKRSTQKKAARSWNKRPWTIDIREEVH